MLALLVLVPVIVGRVDGGAWTDAPTEGRIDQTVELAIVIVDGKTVRAPDSIKSVKLAGKQRATKPLEGARVQWSIIEPHGFRTVKPAANGTTADFYSNVSLEPKTFGKWLGYDSIDGYVNNLANIAYATSIISNPGLNLRFYNPPRTAGIRVRVDW